MAKILITGTTGYLGSCIYQNLIHSCIFADTLTQRLEAIRPNSLEYDYLIHCAGALRHQPDKIWPSNYWGTKKLLKGLKKTTAIIYISTRSVYESTASILTEAAPLKPRDDYGESKLATERLLQASGHPLLILRASTLMGMGQQSLGDSFMAQVFLRLLNHEKILLFQPDRQTDYLYVWDMAHLVTSMIKQKNNSLWGEIFNVAGPHRSLHQLVTTCVQVCQNHFKTRSLIEPITAPSPAPPLLDCSKLRTLCSINYTSDKEICSRAIIQQMQLKNNGGLSN